jgi:hypothetical protein
MVCKQAWSIKIIDTFETYQRWQQLHAYHELLATSGGCGISSMVAASPSPSRG